MSRKNVDCQGHAVVAGNRVKMRLSAGMDVVGTVEFIVNGQVTIRNDQGLLFSQPSRLVTFISNGAAASQLRKGK